jgi:hypothetical protein
MRKGAPCSPASETLLNSSIIPNPTKLQSVKLAALAQSTWHRCALRSCAARSGVSAPLPIMQKDAHGPCGYFGTRFAFIARDPSELWPINFSPPASPSSLSLALCARLRVIRRPNSQKRTARAVRFQIYLAVGCRHHPRSHEVTAVFAFAPGSSELRQVHPLQAILV